MLSTGFEEGLLQEAALPPEAAQKGCFFSGRVFSDCFFSGRVFSLVDGNRKRPPPFLPQEGRSSPLLRALRRDRDLHGLRSRAAAQAPQE